MAAMSLQLVELTEQTALRKIAGSQISAGQRKRIPSERVLKKLSNFSRPPRFRHPSMSNSIPFHPTYNFPSSISPQPLFLSPIPLFTAVSIPHLFLARISPLPIPLDAAVANVVVSTWNRLRNSLESEIGRKERRREGEVVDVEETGTSERATPLTLLFTVAFQIPRNPVRVHNCS